MLNRLLTRAARKRILDARFRSLMIKAMKIIQVLGTGCPKCHKLAANVKIAAQALGLEYELQKITDLEQIMKFGVMTTPALVVDGQVKAAGKVLAPDEIKKLLA